MVKCCEIVGNNFELKLRLNILTSFFGLIILTKLLEALVDDHCIGLPRGVTFMALLLILRANSLFCVEMFKRTSVPCES